MDLLGGFITLFSDPMALGFVFLGALFGVIIGATPGLTTPAAIAMIVPATAYLDPLPKRAGIFGGHTNFGDPDRSWDFRSLGRGSVDFEEIVRALNDIGYKGPLSVEWEDSGMDREHGAEEACDYVNSVDFEPSAVAFDAAFAE